MAGIPTPLPLMVLLLALLPSFSHSAECDSTSKGLIPLTELTGAYKGEAGGLYPGGVNVPPVAHQLEGISIANGYIPLDTLGLPDSTGFWVLLSIGMSNCTQEFSQFILDVAGDTMLHPRLKIVDGAQGGQTAAKIKYDTATFWSVIETRLAAEGLAPLQVRAVWLKEANAGPTGSDLTHAQILRDDLRDAIRVAKQKYPNLVQVFFSSRIYAGYASTTLNPEPYAYESAFAVRWVIQAQLDGNDSLNFDLDLGPVNSPWLAWGPYLWADGIIPRAADSLQWFCSDLVVDGTHPSPTGRLKVSAMLENFFKTSPYTVKWFLKPLPTCCVNPTGNTNGDFNEQINVADVTFFVNYLFRNGPAPSCRDEADADANHAVNVADLTRLVNFLFRAGPPPASCP